MLPKFSLHQCKLSQFITDFTFSKWCMNTTYTDTRTTATDMLGLCNKVDVCFVPTTDILDLCDASDLNLLDNT